MSRRQPVLRPQSVDPPEVTEVAGNDHETATPCVPGDHRVIAADDTTVPLKDGADVAIVGGGGIVKGQNVPSRRETVHRLPVLPRLRRFFGAVKELGQGDGEMHKAGTSALTLSRKPFGRSRRTRMHRLVSSM